LVDELFGDDPNKYLYALAKKGAKIPSKFDVSTILKGATQNQGTTQNTISWTTRMPSSSKMTTSLPFGTKTMEKITHIPTTPTLGKSFASPSSLVNTFRNPLFQNTT
jgi:triacylglycerol esterase/lipase EstA (alpha/beta hydrolase family)